MRSVAQSLLARHPVFTAVGAGCRWCLWFVVGHPFGLLILTLAVIAGLPWWYRGLVWAGAEVALGLWAFAGLTSGAKSLFLWTHLCRFRRRWPAQFARAYRSPRWPPVVADNHYSVPGGLRPTFTAPQLSVLPQAFDHRTIGWRLLPLAEHDVAELTAAVSRVGGADDRIGSIGLRSLPAGGLALIVRFRRQGTGRSSLLATGLASLALDDDPIDPALDPLADRLEAPAMVVGEPIGVSSSDESMVRLGELAGDLHDADMFAGEGSALIGSADVPLIQPSGRQDDFADWSTIVGGPTGFVANLPPNDPERKRRSGFPMKWSFSVILPSNILMALVVGASDAGRVGILAVCAAAFVSVILIVAEGVSDR